MYVICMYLFIWMLLLYVRARECMCKCVFGRCPATSLCFLCCLLQCGWVMSYVILLFMLSFAMHVGYVLLSYFAFYVVFCKACGWCPAYAILLSSSSTIWKKKVGCFMTANHHVQTISLCLCKGECIFMYNIPGMCMSCVSVYTWTCMHVCVHVCMVLVRVCVCVCMCVCVYVCVGVCACKHVRACVCATVCMDSRNKSNKRWHVWVWVS